MSLYMFIHMYIVDEIEQLKSELARAANETEKWKKEAQLARERYELYGTQLNHNIVQMSTKVKLKRLKW